MPSGSYEVTQKPNTPQNNDQSYRNCVITMFLFVMMCIIIILATWPWRKTKFNNNYLVEEIDSQYSEQFKANNDSKFERLEEMRTTISPEEEIKTEAYENKNGTEEIKENVPDFVPSTSEKNYLSSSPGGTSESSWIDDETFRVSNEDIEFSSPRIESLETISPSLDFIGTTTVSTDYFIRTSSSPESSSVSSDTFESSSESNDISSGFSSTSEDSATKNEEYSTDSTEFSSSEDEEKSTSYSTDSTINMTEAPISGSTENSLDTTATPEEEYSLLKRLTITYFETEFTNDMQNTKSTTKWVKEEDIKLSTTGDSSETPELTTDVAEAKFSTPSSTNPPVFTTQEEKKLISEALKQTTPKSDEETPVCMSGQCKQLSSKILSYMNHSADPCDDFYEYACGGMESDPEIRNVDLSAQVVEKIKNSMKKLAHLPEHFSFTKYFNSCREYNEYSNKSQRIIQAKETLKNIGKFYTASDWPHNYKLTQLIANMILHNNPILFDIVPDVNEKNPEKFILSFQPPDNLSKYFDQTSCIEEVDDLSEEIDLEEIYNNYKSCKNNTRKLNNFVTKALKDFGIFEEFSNSENHTEYINEISIDIHFQIVKVLISNYPPESEINAAYKSKNYDVITLGDLEDHSKLLNWTQLISTITGMTLESEDKIQVYFKDNLFGVLDMIEKFSRTNLRELNNALLGLYATNLYNEFVEIKPFKDSEENCFIIAMNYLPKEASSLYISSFSRNDLDLMNSTIEKILTELKVTLKINFERSEWAAVEGRNQLIKKLEGLKVSIPNIADLNSNLQLNMENDYFNNTVELMKNLRRQMYNMLQLNPSNPEQLWTYFSKPYKLTPQTLNSLSLILIPLGAIDWPLIQKYDQTFDYFIFSNVGNLIAREIANCFDSNGIKYWNGIRDSPFALLDDVFTKTNYEDYINCQNQSLFQEPIHMLLSSHNQHIRFKMPQSTLNSRLSDAMGVKLAHETLVRVGSTSPKLLPWLNLNIDQLFYLTYAQSYCSKIPLTNFLTSLYENTILPSRVRILAATTNNKAFGELWKCPEGSQLLPNFSCRVFPNLEYQSVVIETA